MGTFEFAFLAFTSLFVIIDPIAAVPTFLAMTTSSSAQERSRTAALACTIACAILIAFAATGKFIFKVFGITLPAFQIAGSIVLLLVALDMLQAKRSAVQETSEEKTEGVLKEEVAVTPLGVPMLAGPGAISTAILLQHQASGWEQKVFLYIAIIAACFSAYLVFRLAVRGAKWLSPIAMRIIIRLMGLLLASVAMQFLINALQEVGPKIFRS